ncbi:MAG: hypothetical protein K6E52_00645 [Bacteroidaceae bacterium]|nr:hypothetical protein [Bacteroidaceae bacterium]
MIRLSIEELSFSAKLPNSFDIVIQNGEVASVSIALNNQLVYATSLYATEGVATFYELRQIVELNMVAMNISLAEFQLTVSYEGGEEVLGNRFIVFSKCLHNGISDSGFLNSHFLTNRSFYSMPVNGVATVDFFANDGEVLNCQFDCVMVKNGEMVSHALLKNIAQHGSPDIYQMSIGPETVMNELVGALGTDCGKLLSYRVRVGNRQLDVFVVDDTPCAVFSFRNAFNALESVFVFGNRVMKTEINRKEAVCMNIASFYDKSVTRKWMVATAPMEMEEASVFNEFLEADFVSMGQGMEEHVVLIDDVSSEINESGKDLIAFKFSYRFNDNALWIV